MKERMMENWLYRIGEINKYTNMPNRGMRFPADRKKNYVRYSNMHQRLRNKRISMTWTNWWCRDQNFRKYFEMRKKNGIRPGTTGFYHIPIWKETNAKNAEIARIRESRQGV